MRGHHVAQLERAARHRVLERKAAAVGADVGDILLREVGREHVGRAVRGEALAQVGRVVLVREHGRLGKDVRLGAGRRQADVGGEGRWGEGGAASLFRREAVRDGEGSGEGNGRDARGPCRNPNAPCS